MYTFRTRTVPDLCFAFFPTLSFLTTLPRDVSSPAPSTLWFSPQPSPEGGSSFPLQKQPFQSLLIPSAYIRATTDSSPDLATMVLARATHLSEGGRELWHLLLLQDANKHLVASCARKPALPTQPVHAFPAWRAVIPEGLRWAEDRFSQSLPSKALWFRKPSLLRFTLSSPPHKWSHNQQSSSPDSEHPAVSLRSCKTALVRRCTACSLGRGCPATQWNALPPVWAFTAAVCFASSSEGTFALSSNFWQTPLWVPQETWEAITDQPHYLHLRLTGSKFITSMISFTDYPLPGSSFRWNLIQQLKIWKKMEWFIQVTLCIFPSQNHTMWGPKKRMNTISLLTPFQLWLCLLTGKMARLIEGNCSSTIQFLFPQVFPVLVCILPALSKLQCRTWCWHASPALSTWRNKNHIVIKVLCRWIHCPQQKGHSHSILSDMYKWSIKKYWIGVSW